jgi:antitoxin CptB
MDILLKGFVNNVIDTLNKEELSILLDLISVDDDNLYKFKTGTKTSILIKENKITKLFKDFTL